MYRSNKFEWVGIRFGFNYLKTLVHYYVTQLNGLKPDLAKIYNQS